MSGEHNCIVLNQQDPIGSSPRERGAPEYRFDRDVYRRIIPA